MGNWYDRDAGTEEERKKRYRELLELRKQIQEVPTVGIRFDYDNNIVSIIAHHGYGETTEYPPSQIDHVCDLIVKWWTDAGNAERGQREADQFRSRFTRERGESV